MPFFDVDQLFENAFYSVLPFCLMRRGRTSNLFTGPFCHIYYYNEKAEGGVNQRSILIYDQIGGMKIATFERST
jgi:hypothetical protein